MTRSTLPGRRGLLLTAIVIVSAVMFSPSPACAQPSRTEEFARSRAESVESAPDDWEFQYDLFISLLTSNGLSSVNSVLELDDARSWNRKFPDPSDSVVVFTGQLSRVNSLTALNDFVSRGGMVLIATNHRLRIPGLLRIEFGPVIATDSSTSYRRYTDCLRIRSFDRTSELFENVDSIVTNRCGSISSVQRSSLAPSWSFPIRLPESVRPDFVAGRPLLAVSQPANASTGQIIVLADGSPLTNGMLWHEDNAQFAINLSAVLARDRSTFAFLHHGRPATDRIPGMLIEEAIYRSQFDHSSIPPEAIPPEALRNLPVETLAKIANHVITRVEDSNVFNKLLVDRPRAAPERFYRRSILLTVAVIAGGFFLVRSWLTAQPALPWSSTGDRRTNTQESTSPSELSYERAALSFSRQVCCELTSSVEPDDWTGQLSVGGSVRRRLCDSSHDRQATETAVDHLLRWSSMPEGRRLSEDEFLQVGNSLRHLRQLVSQPRGSTTGRR